VNVAEKGSDGTVDAEFDEILLAADEKKRITGMHSLRISLISAC
jgi:hypothetical protein